MEQVIDFEAYLEIQGMALSAKYPMDLANCQRHTIRWLYRGDDDAFFLQRLTVS